MKFSRYVDQLVQNSECFLFDAYTQGFRRYIQAQALAGSLGVIEEIEVDPYRKNTLPLALVLGETNRLFSRYKLIANLLDTCDEGHSKKKSQYYQTLYRYYQKKNIIERARGHREIYRKIDRIRKIDLWLKNHGTLEGINAYLSNEEHKTCRNDFPITLTVASSGTVLTNIQLDGSHRRSISFYNKLPFVKSLRINLDDALLYLSDQPEPYLTEYKDQFLSVLKSFDYV